MLVKVRLAACVFLLQAPVHSSPASSSAPQSVVSWLLVLSAPLIASGAATSLATGASSSALQSVDSGLPVPSAPLIAFGAVICLATAASSSAP